MTYPGKKDDLIYWATLDPTTTTWQDHQAVTVNVKAYLKIMGSPSMTVQSGKISMTYQDCNGDMSYVTFDGHKWTDEAKVKVGVAPAL